MSIPPMRECQECKHFRMPQHGADKASCAVGHRVVFRMPTEAQIYHRDLRPYGWVRRCTDYEELPVKRTKTRQTDEHRAEAVMEGLVRKWRAEAERQLYEAHLPGVPGEDHDARERDASLMQHLADELEEACRKAWPGP